MIEMNNRILKLFLTYLVFFADQQVGHEFCAVINSIMKVI